MTTTLKKLFASVVALALLGALPVQASVGIGQSQTNTLTNGLVGYWTFDGKDTNWKTGQLTDRSGQGNTGQLLGLSTTTSVAIGKVGQAFKFNRNTTTASGYVQVQDSTSLGQSAASSFTVSLWINPASNYSDGSNDNIIEKAIDSSSPGWGIYRDVGGNLKARLSCTNGVNGCATGFVDAILGNFATYFATSTWTHAVLVINKSTNIAQWYVNGQAIGSGTAIAAITSMVNNHTLDIGAGAQGLGVDTFGGMLDDVRIYNRALSAQEVAQLYVAGGGKIAQSQTNTLTSGLVGYWTLDGSATNWKTGVESDKSGQGNTCVLRSGLATTTTISVGKIGQAFTFTGVDTGNLDCGNQTAFQTNQQTLVAWIKTPNAGNAFRSVVAKSLAFGMYLYNNNLATYDNGASALRNSGVTLNDNKWHQVAIAFNSGVSNGTYMYVDGVVVASTTVTIVGQTVQMRIGFGQSGGQVFNGQIDDVRVYNRQLSAQEIAQLYKTGGGTIAQSNATLLKTGLIGYWPFDGSSLNWKTGSATDVSGQGNTGSLGNLSTTTSIFLGKVGQTLNLNGVDSYVAVPHASNQLLTSGGSFSAWIYPRTQGEIAGRIIDKGTDTAGSGGYVFSIQSNKVLVVINGGVQRLSAATVPYGKWTHVAATFDSTGFVTVYVNGVVSGTPGVSAAASGITTTNSLCIGNRSAASGTCNTDRAFDGYIDDVRVYSRVLSPQEITQLYASTK